MLRKQGFGTGNRGWHGFLSSRSGCQHKNQMNYANFKNQYYDSVRVSMCPLVSMCVRVSMCTRVRASIWMRVCLCRCVCVYVYFCLCVCRLCVSVREEVCV